VAAIITAATLRAPPAREGGCRVNPRRRCTGWTPCCPRWRSDVLVGVLDLTGKAHDVACQIGACPPRQSPQGTMHHSEAHRRAAPQIQALMEEPLGPMMAACCCMASWRPRQQGQSGVAGRHINRGKCGPAAIWIQPTACGLSHLVARRTRRQSLHRCHWLRAARTRCCGDPADSSWP